MSEQIFEEGTQTISDTSIDSLLRRHVEKIIHQMATGASVTAQRPLKQGTMTAEAIREHNSFARTNLPAGCASEPERALSQAFGQLAMLVNDHARLIDILWNRLESVTVKLPDSSNGQTGSQAPRALGCPLVEEIRGVANHVEGINRRLKTLLDCLQV